MNLLLFRQLIPYCCLVFLCFPLALKAQSLDSLSLEELNAEANALLDAYKYKEAVPYVRRIADLEKEKRGALDSTYAETRGTQAILCFHTSQYDESKTCFLELLDIYKQTKGVAHPYYLRVLSNLGALSESMAEYEQAEAYYKENIRIRKQMKDANKTGKANVLNNLAVLYYNLGRYEEALPLYKQVLWLDKETVGEEHINYAISLGNIASLYGDLGQYEKALMTQEQSMRIRKKAVGEEHPSVANGYNNLAMLYDELGQLKKAETAYLKALDIFAKTSGKEDDSYSVALVNLAELYADYKQYDKAEKMYKESMAITSRVLGKTHPNYGLSLQILGSLYEDMGRYDTAKKMYEEALVILENGYGKKHFEVAIHYTTLARFYLKMKAVDKALECAYKSLYANSFSLTKTALKDVDMHALLQEHQFVSVSTVLKALHKMVDAYRFKYEETKDIQHLKNALDILAASDHWGQKMEDAVNSEQDKLKVLEEVKSTAQNAVQVAFELYQNTNDKKYVNEAFSFFESNKSALLAGAIKAERALSFGNVPDSLLQAEKDYRVQINDLKKALLEAKDSVRQTLEEDLLDATHKKEQLIAELEQKYPKYHTLKYQKEAFDIAAVQRDLLDSESLLLEYFVHDTVTYVLAITDVDMELFAVEIEKDRLAEMVELLRRGLSDYTFLTKDRQKAYDLYTTQAYRFCKELVKPAITHFSSQEKLIVVADDLLGYIPFEALLLEMPEQGEEIDYRHLEYLIREYEISYSYSTNLLMDNINHHHQNQTAPQLVAFAAAYPEANKRLEKVPDSRSHYHRELRKVMADLPSAISEVQQLEALFPKGQFYYGDAATEKAFYKAASTADIIHFAMHGNLNAKHPLLSNLAFTEDGDKAYDNFVEAHELSTLELQANLVVLSACETGYGKFQHGEGVLSLARSFMYAGVPSLLVSLWQVNDNSTELIMRLFYENLREGMTKSAALQQAKLTYIENTGTIVSHPAFWAPFIQLGDAQPIIKQKTYWLELLLGALGIVLVSFGIRRYSQRKEVV